MRVIAVCHRANQRGPVHDPRDAGHVFADLQTGDRRVDRMELAADFDGGFWLHVEHVLVTGTTKHIEQNHRFGFGFFVGVSNRRMQQFGDRHPSKER